MKGLIKWKAVTNFSFSLTSISPSIATQQAISKISTKGIMASIQAEQLGILCICKREKVERRRKKSGEGKKQRKPRWLVARGSFALSATSLFCCRPSAPACKATVYVCVCVYMCVTVCVTLRISMHSCIMDGQTFTMAAAMDFRTLPFAVHLRPEGAGEDGVSKRRTEACWAEGRTAVRLSGLVTMVPLA